MPKTSDPVAEWCDKRLPKVERFVVTGSPFELDLAEVLSGTAYTNIDTQREARIAASPLIRKKFGANLKPGEIGLYTWVEHSCVALYKNGEKVADRITFDQVVRLSQKTGDLMIAAGIRAQILTIGDLLELKKAPTSEQQEASEEKSE